MSSSAIDFRIFLILGAATFLSLVVLDSGSQEDSACACEPLLLLRRGRRALCVLGVWLSFPSHGHVGAGGEGGLFGVWSGVWYGVSICLFKNQTGLYFAIRLKSISCISGFTSVFDNFEAFAKQQGFEWS